MTGCRPPIGQRESDHHEIVALTLTAVEDMTTDLPPHDPDTDQARRPAAEPADTEQPIPASITPPDLTR